MPARVWRATALLVLGRVLSAACAFVSLGLLARHLTGASFGLLTFYLVVLGLLDALADFGTSNAVLQRGAGDARGLARAMAAARRIRAAASLSGFALVTAGAWVAGEGPWPWVACAALVPLTRVLELSAVVYADRIAHGVPVAVRSGVSVLRLLGVLALVRAGAHGPGPFLLLHAFLGGAGNVALHLVVRRQVPRPDDRDESAPPRRNLLAAALPLAVCGLAQHGYFYADNFVLRALRDEVELGRYNAAVRILTFFVLAAGFATQAALPWLARRHRSGDLGRATLRLAAPLTLAAVPVALCVAPRAERLLELVFGPGFDAAGPSLRWLLVAGCIVHAGAAPLTAVIATGRFRALLVIVLAGLAANLAGNLALVPRLGIEGAAIATCATELLVLVGAAAVLLGERGRMGRRGRT